MSFVNLIIKRFKIDGIVDVIVRFRIEFVDIIYYLHKIRLSDENECKFLT